jgi:hypothetical protein
MARSRPVPLLGLLAAVCLTAACTATAPVAPAAQTASPSAPPGGIDPGTAFTPLTAATLTTPAPVTGTDGAVHLAYELLLTNATGADLRLDRVEVLDAADNQVVASLSGPQLAAATTPVATPTGDDAEPPPDPPTIPGSSTSVVWLDVVPPGAVPAALVHRVSMVIPRPGGDSTVESVVGRVATSTAAAPVLGPPLQGGPWYASDGCCADDTHHRRGLAPINGEFLVPQRFAVDWYLLDDRHRALVGDPARISDYLSYDKPTIAAADGVVVDALDGLPDTTTIPQPPKIPPIKDTVGNHVILQIAPQTYLLYAHLRPGTVAVTTGQQVRKGDVLGHIGSSGNSTIPHLHFQVLTTPTFFPADSTPFAFDCVDLQGRITERIWDDVLGLQPNPELPFAAAPDPGPRRGQMPLDRAVLTFGC